MRLHTEIIGTGADLVLLHGWGTNLAVWSSILNTLAGRFRVTLIELPGHGESDYDPSLGSLGDWVEACLDAAPERSAWIGWSLGGLITQRAAVIAPGRISRVAVIAGTPCFVRGEGWPYAMDPETLRQFSTALAQDHRQALGRFLSLQVQGDSEARRTLRTLRQGLFNRPDPHPAALAAGLELLLTVDLRQQLSSLVCPTLWLLGGRDTLVPPAVGDELRQWLPSAKIKRLPGAAHVPFLSHSAPCLDALQDFLVDGDA